MSLTVRRGKQWFRPMEVQLRITLTDYEKANNFVQVLRVQGFENEARELAEQIRAEEQDTKAHETLGYICDPEDRYKDGHLK